MTKIKALKLYKLGKISIGKLGDLLNINKWDTLNLLTEEKIPLNYGKEDFDEDTKVLDSKN